jgi:glycosyltransferase involved in cell wall biosynthesis
VVVIGPIDLVQTPMHARLIFRGVVPHEKLPDVLNGVQAFIMPFKVTPLVEGVDPVKLYEYLAFGKEVIAVRYPEIERFEKFVHLYTSNEHAFTLFKKLSNKVLEQKNRINTTSEFLKQNTWSTRAAALLPLLNKVAPMLDKRICE